MSDALTETIDAEIFVEGAEAPAEEKRLRDLVRSEPGIDDLTIAHCRVDVRYDPTKVNKAELTRCLESAGFHVLKVETALTSPVVDSTVNVPDDDSPPLERENMAADSPVADAAVSEGQSRE